MIMMMFMMTNFRVTMNTIRKIHQIIFSLISAYFNDNLIIN
jgi:hypothetical protein